MVLSQDQKGLIPLEAQRSGNYAHMANMTTAG